MNIRDLVDLNDSIRAVIIDSHRPIHHSYNNDDDNMVCVVIAPDDYVNKHEVPGSDQMYEYLGGWRAMIPCSRQHGRQHDVSMPIWADVVHIVKVQVVFTSGMHSCGIKPQCIHSQHVSSLHHNST